jgi:DNA-dependent metalloprotease WSS1
MREHHLYVMSLEEFPANREFVGRNFNAGEVIQLVLKSPGTGRWLPFEYVQMVMMHELAHCKQMNHSKAFWAVRNQYASQMQVLFSKGYTGDGIWGRGASLATGWERNTVRTDEALPEHLCGGTYRSRRRKRKVKPILSYQERKERRILKKFGKNGTTLGADNEVKAKLEKGKRVQAKPRVAGSARGRELRAAAALARFEKKKDEDEDEIVIKEEQDVPDSGSESDYEDGDAFDSDNKDAIDLDGSRLTDGKGRGLVKVCEDELGDDPAARTELEELRNAFRSRSVKRESPNAVDSAPSTAGPLRILIKDEPADHSDVEFPPSPESASAGLKP